MNTPTWSVSRSCVLTEVRAELVRLGLAKEDFDRCRVTVDEVDREVLRLAMERRRPVAVILGEILARIGLGALPAQPSIQGSGDVPRQLVAESLSS